MRYLGVDFGLRRIGLSISEGDLASPYKVIEGTKFAELVEKVKKEAIGFDKIIVGLPEGKIGQTVLGFIKALKKSGLDVETADETLSSKQATERMIQLNVSKKDRRMTDSMAAAIILQNYLDFQT